MRRHADLRQLRHQIFADAIVQNALAVEHGFLGGVERRRVVLEIGDERAGLWAFIENLGLAFVDLAAAFHGHGFSSQAKIGKGAFQPPLGSQFSGSRSRAATRRLVATRLL